MSNLIIKFLAPFLIVAFLFSSCSPNPRRLLTEDERVADLLWLTSKIEANYAPLRYKEEKRGFDYEAKKSEYLELARKEQSNEAFYMLMKKFVAEFGDGHMNASLNQSALPGRSKVAYMGFKGHRNGENFLITEFIPTFKQDSAYPIKKDDEILEFNGQKLKAAVDALMTPYRDVGNKEANYTILMGSLFLRSSLAHPMPDEDSVVLKVKRGTEEFEVEVPWVVEDYAKFAKAQREAAAAKAQAKGIDFEREEIKIKSLLQIAGAHPYVTDSFVKNAIFGAGAEIDAAKILEKLSTLDPTHTFEFKRAQGPALDLEVFDLVAEKLEAEEKKEEDKEEDPNLAKLKKERYTPATIYMVPAAKTYPAYVAIETKDDKRSAIGYIRMDTFSPAAEEKVVIKEFKDTLKFFRDFGVEGVDKVVIDLIDNGGGSLSLGLKLSALLSSTPIEMPTMKYMLNDSWMDQYESSSMTNVNDAARELSARVFKEMLTSFERGERLSEKAPVSSLYPFSIVANTDLVLQKKPYSFELAVLTNEMCASMCDIFSSILKENEMATFIGKQTMGAGGNVVSHYFAPNSGMMVSLTESLVVSGKGEYLENNGVKPDVEVEVNESKKAKYEAVIKKAFEELLK